MGTPEINSCKKHFKLLCVYFSCFLTCVRPWPGCLFKSFLGKPESSFVPEYNLEQLMILIAEKEYGIALSIQMHFIFYDCLKSCNSFSKISRTWSYVKSSTFKIYFHKEAIAARISRIITALLFPGISISIPALRIIRFCFSFMNVDFNSTK